jgi:hypothetical protein
VFFGIRAKTFWPEGVVAPKNPIVGSLAACWAPAASGHAAAPPTIVTRHSLPGGLLGLTWAGLTPADRASFAGAFTHSITSSDSWIRGAPQSEFLSVMDSVGKGGP